MPLKNFQVLNPFVVTAEKNNAEHSKIWDLKFAYAQQSIIFPWTTWRGGKWDPNGL